MSRVRIPFTGLYRPVNDFSPEQASGKFKELRNWEVRDGVLKLIDGVQAEPYTITGTTFLYNFFPYEGDNVSWQDNYYALFVKATGTNTNDLVSWENVSGTTTTYSGWTASGSLIRGGAFGDELIVGVHSGLFAVDVITDSFRELGVAAPSVTPSGTTGSGNGLTGVYSLVYTKINADGHEGNPSTQSNDVSVTDADIEWTVGGAGSTTELALYPYLRLYRTVAGGSAYLYLTQISNTSSTQTTYTDSTPDISLGDEAEYDNDAPGNVDDFLCTPNRIYLLHENKIYASKFDKDTSEPNIDAFPSAWNVYVKGGGAYFHTKCWSIEMIGGKLIALSGVHISLIAGDFGVNPTVVPLFEYGIMGPLACIHVKATAKHPEGLVMYCTDQKIRFWDGENAPQVISEDISDLLDGMFWYVTTPYPQVTYEETNDRLIVILPDIPSAYAGQTGCQGLVYNWGSSWSVVDWSFPWIVYNDVKRITNAIKATDSTIYYLTGYKNGNTFYTTQTVEWWPIWFGEKAHYVQRLGLRVKAQPIVNYVPPTLTVYWGTNGEPPDTNYKVYDLSSDALAQGTQRKAVTLWIPINRFCTDVTLKVVPTANTASIASGCEIYDLFMDVSEAEDAHDQGMKRSDRDLPEGAD